MKVFVVAILTALASSAQANIHPDWYYVVPKKMECLFDQDRIKILVQVGDVPTNNPSFTEAHGSAQLIDRTGTYAPVDYPGVIAHRTSDGKISVIYPYKARPATLMIIETRVGEMNWNKYVMAESWPGPKQGACKFIID